MTSPVAYFWQANFQVYGVAAISVGTDSGGTLYGRTRDAPTWSARREARQGGANHIGDMAAPCPLDRVNRQFKADRPNQLWVSDFTYVSTWVGFVYVAYGQATREKFAA